MAGAVITLILYYAFMIACILITIAFICWIILWFKRNKGNVKNTFKMTKEERKKYKEETKKKERDRRNEIKNYIVIDNPNPDSDESEQVKGIK